MAALAALWLHAYGAKGQGDVVNDDKEALKGDVLLVHPIAHGIAREVHICGGLEEEEFLVFYSHPGYEAVALVLKADASIGGELVGDAETNVVTCGGVFVTDISQTGYEVKHSGLINN